MSIRPQCSYWVTITGPRETLNDIMELLLKRRHELNYMTVACTGTDIEMEVTDGATEQTDEVETLCGALAREFPGADISYSEVNEELYTPDRFMTWKNGQKVKDAFGRKLDPDCLDPETIRTCIDVISGIQVHTLPEAKQALQKLLEQST